MYEWITPSVWRQMVRAAYEKKYGIDAVNEAIDFWEANFSNTQDFQKHIRPFSAAFTEFIGKPELKTEMAFQLITALHTLPDFLPEDPRGAGLPKPLVASVAPATAPPAFSNQAPADVCFESLVKHITQALAIHPEGKQYIQQYAQMLESKPTAKVAQFSSTQQASWLNWLKTQKNLALNISAEQGRTVINAIYIFLTKAVGPVDADVVLNNAVVATEQLPQAREFSPRSFL